MKKKRYDAVITLLKDNYSVIEIADILNISKSTVYRYRREYLNSIKTQEDTFDKYRTKTQLYYHLPAGKDIDVEWNKLNLERIKNRILLDLYGISSEQAWFNKTDLINQTCRIIDEKTKQDLKSLTSVLNSKLAVDIRNETFALEAFYSSKIEGAYTTKRVAKNIIKGKKIPKNKHEMMIYNNQQALEYGLSNIDKLCTHEYIFKLHDIINSKCLRGEKFEENGIYGDSRYIDLERNSYRKDDDIGVVNGRTGKVVHQCAPVYKINSMMDELLKFMEESKLHPIINSAIIHFFFVYIHPFSDGNGRTARALSYLYLINNGYELFKNFSISYIIEKYKGKYYKSILACEEDQLNLTYFIEFSNLIYYISINEVLAKFERAYIEGKINEYCEEKYIMIDEFDTHIIRFILIQENKSISMLKYMKKCESKYRRHYGEDFSVEIVKRFEKLCRLGIITEITNINEYKVSDKFRVDI